MTVLKLMASILVLEMIEVHPILAMDFGISNFKPGLTCPLYPGVQKQIA